RRPARRSAGVMFVVVRIAGRAVVRVEARHVDAELVHVRLANDQGAGGPQPGDDRRVVRRGHTPKKARTERRAVTGDVHLVLDRDRYSVPRSKRHTTSPAIGARSCLLVEIIGANTDKRPERAWPLVARAPLGEKPLGDVHWRERLPAVRLDKVSRAMKAEPGWPGR